MYFDVIFTSESYSWQSWFQTCYRPTQARRCRRIPGPGAHFIARFSQCVPHRRRRWCYSEFVFDEKRRPRYRSLVNRRSSRATARLIVAPIITIREIAKVLVRVSLSFLAVNEKKYFVNLCRDLTSRVCFVFQPYGVFCFSRSLPPFPFILVPCTRKTTTENECHDPVDCYGDYRCRNGGKCCRSQMRQCQAGLRSARLSAQRYSEGRNFMWVRDTLIHLSYFILGTKRLSYLIYPAIRETFGYLSFNHFIYVYIHAYVYLHIYLIYIYIFY